MKTVRTVAGRTDRVVVVGAGLSGLAAALHLAGAGREVTVLERRDGPGGLAGQLRIDGYSFDTGPTVLTMPDTIARALNAVGEELTDWLDLIPLDPIYRAFYPGGERLDIRADPAHTAEEIAAFAGAAEAARYRRFVDWLEKLYRLQIRDFVDRNIDSPLDLPVRSLAKLAALGGFGRLEPAVRKYLRDSRVRRAFTFQSLYVGLAPHQALALYAIVSYLDTVGGVVFPRGGMHAVPRALAGAAAKHGVQFRYDTTVTEVDMAAGRARAVHTAGGERIPADAVVLATDLPAAYRDLLGRQPRPLRTAPSCVLLHIGASSAYSQIAHHNLHFGRAWRRTFHELTHGELMSDPSLLVSNPSRTDPTLAPAGRHTYYVLAPAPTGGPDWSVVGRRYADELLETLHERGYRNLTAEVQQLVTPDDWRAVGCTAGTPFAAAHTLGQTGPFRPGNLVGDNIVLAGAWTHPGVGVPMVLISGRLAARRIVG